MKSKLLLVIIVVILFSFPKISLGQAPDLDATFGFALFTASGALGNVGATNITGDIGTNVGAITGFPPGNVSGQIHWVDSVSAQAAIDVNTAYSYLVGITCDTIIGDTLGNSQILTPNVYCLGGASLLNGDLTLDGQGNPNALFIFKINGALSTSALSNIILIDSACLCNVYWQINGAYALGDSSIFRGTIITNGAISLAKGSSLLGRGLSRQGAIALDNNIVATEVPINPLPIGLLSFVARKAGVNIQLNWSTASETNNHYFNVECSKDGISFKEVLQMPGAGNSDIDLYYLAIDYKPYDGTSYYRLKQTDFDGKSIYSNLITIDFEKIIDFTIYPNPFSTSINITLNDVSQNGQVELRIFNVLGAEVMNTTITKQLTTLETINLPPGIYFYKITSDNKTTLSGRLISQQ